MIKKVTVKTLKKYKDTNEKFSMLTAYDYSTAKYIDEAGIDVILVGDSAAMVVLGYENTNNIGIDEMALFTKAVSRGAKRALIVADMPFMSFTDISEGLKNAGRLIQSGANAVKIESLLWHIWDLHRNHRIYWADLLSKAKTLRQRLTFLNRRKNLNRRARLRLFWKWYPKKARNL